MSETTFSVAKVERPKDSVGCRYCVGVCKKEAILVRWPDGSLCDALNERAPVEEAV